MLFVDANAILRYLLYDNTDMADKVCKLIEKNKIFIRYEVLAEVVYVLNKVYSMPRAEIAGCVEKFLRPVKCGNGIRGSLVFSFENIRGSKYRFY